MKGSKIRSMVKELEEKTIHEIIDTVEKTPFKEAAYFFVIDIDSNKKRKFYKKNKEELKKSILKEISLKELEFNQFYCLMSIYTEGFDMANNSIIMDIIESEGPNSKNAKILWIINIAKGNMFFDNDEDLIEISKLV